VLPHGALRSERLAALRQARKGASASGARNRPTRPDPPYDIAGRAPRRGGHPHGARAGKATSSKEPAMARPLAPWWSGRRAWSSCTDGGDECTAECLTSPQDHRLPIRLPPPGDRTVRLAARGRQNDPTAQPHLLWGAMRRQPLLNLVPVAGVQRQGRDRSGHDSAYRNLCYMPIYLSDTTLVVQSIAHRNLNCHAGLS
jgi:hypothetical protein